MDEFLFQAPVQPGDYEAVRLHLQTLFDAAIVMA